MYQAMKRPHSSYAKARASRQICTRQALFQRRRLGEKCSRTGDGLSVVLGRPKHHDRLRRAGHVELTTTGPTPSRGQTRRPNNTDSQLGSQSAGPSLEVPRRSLAWAVRTINAYPSLERGLRVSCASAPVYELNDFRWVILLELHRERCSRFGRQRRCSLDHPTVALSGISYPNIRSMEPSPNPPPEVCSGLKPYYQYRLRWVRISLGQLMENAPASASRSCNNDHGTVLKARLRFLNHPVLVNNGKSNIRTFLQCPRTVEGFGMHFETVGLSIASDVAVDGMPE